MGTRQIELTVSQCCVVPWMGCAGMNKHGVASQETWSDWNVWKGLPFDYDVKGEVNLLMNQDCAIH